MKKEKLLKRGLASLLAVVLAVGLLPMMPGNMATVKAADGDKTVSLGTDVIKNPTAPTASTDTWKGSYVYFGTYGGNPVKYRVLDKNTTVFGGTTMLLDCDSILWAGSNPSSAFDDNSNDWANSNIRTYLNETFLTNNFSAVEQSAIASSTKSTAYSGTDGADGDGWDGTLSYASLSNDKIFFLDAKEATNTSYGYSNNDGSAANREKTGGNAFWWLRSADSYDPNLAGIVYSDGFICSSDVYDIFVGVSPALNINLSSVLFTSVISGTKGETGAEYKLTLLDNDMTIAGNGNVSRSGDTVTVPYTISGTNSGSATQVSVLILDKEYTAGNTNGATVLAYKKLAVDSFSVTGTGTFTLPAELLDKTCGTDYYAYIIAEDVNGEKETDYASTPVSITVPAKPWEAPTVNAINIGTPGIIDPAVPSSTSDAWKGSYVYFGTYNGNPVKYRVLDKNTTVFGGTTMLLDCDSILWAGTNGDNQSSAFDDDSNVWANSNIKTYLNGTFLTSNFSTAEQNAIASSTKSAEYSTDGNGWSYLSYASLSNDKIFFLDAKEATNTSYGYSNNDGSAANREKTGGNAYWWLRSAYTIFTLDAGIVISVGDFFNDIVDDDYVGVSPALNINLSSVLFTSVGGTSKSSALTAASSQIGETTGTEWKLTLVDTGKTVQITENKNAIKAADGTITVPYTYTDTATTDAEKVNQISVMITDDAYTTEGAEILYYGALQDIKDANESASIVSDAATGTGTFELPGGLTGTLGTDYHVYILAEHVNENSNATDYASTPVEITAIYNTIDTVEASINTPKGGQPLSTDITCTTDGVESATLSWTDTVNQPVDAIANYYPWTYKAHITVTPKPGYAFTTDTQITVNGTVLEDEKTVNADGTITVTGAFQSSRDKLISITAPQSIRVANGTAYASMNLPTEVNIETEEGAATTAAVSWDTTTPASGSYDEAVLTEQTVTLNGTVTCPDSINANGVELTTTITITISAAGIVGAPTANPTAGTYTENQSVTLTSSTEGATIYYTTDGSEPTITGGVPGGTTQKYTAPIAVTGTEGKSVQTTIKAIAVKDRMQNSEVSTFSYTIEIPDTTAPTAEIKIGTNSWKKFWNTVTFGHFFKNTKTVTITASDNVTTSPKIEYYLSDKELTETEVQADSISWKDYTEAIDIPANSKKIVYAKVIDEAGNTIIINSAGVVVYTDSAADTTEITYIKNVTGDVTADVILNGNTVAGIKNESDTLISGSDYTVDENGKITFKKEYLQTLSVGTYTLTVSYNPMGESFVQGDGNEAPNTTELSLTVKNPKLISITQPAAIDGVANGTEKTAEALGLPATVTIVTEDMNITTADMTWELTDLASGTYDPSVLTEQSFTVNGTVTLPQGIDNPDNVDLNVTVSVTVIAAGIVGVPTANPTAGTYTQNQSVTFTSSTEGATIYYTTDGSEPTLEGGVPGGTTKEYTAPIAVTGTEGQSITTAIKAIAVKSGMQNSSVETFTYTIQIPVPKYTVTVTNGSGSGQYAQGEMVTITASAAPEGQQFKEWEIVSGNITLASSTSETTTFTMPAEEVSVKAIYEAVPVTEYTITATAGANGTISPNGAVRVTAGGSQTFTISPSSGYVIDSLKVDGLEVTAATSYTFSDINANHTIEAAFKQESQTPVVTVPSITTQPGNATVKVGETATFTIAATGTDLTYQWQIDRNDGNGWVNIAGATATSYTTSTVDISCNGFKYQCVVSNLAGTVTSNTAVLTVTENSTPDPDPIDYNILDGANSSWTQNSDGSLSIRGSGAFSKFVGVKVDGSLVDAKNYTVKEGSTIVTLKADYLNTLSVGTHTFEILWTDGSASTTFTIKADTSDDGDKKDDVPKTGDNTPVAWLFILSILSGTGLIITAKKRRVNPDSSKR